MAPQAVVLLVTEAGVLLHNNRRSDSNERDSDQACSLLRRVLVCVQTTSFKKNFTLNIKLQQPPRRRTDRSSSSAESFSLYRSFLLPRLHPAISAERVQSSVVWEKRALHKHRGVERAQGDGPRAPATCRCVCVC